MSTLANKASFCCCYIDRVLPLTHRNIILVTKEGSRWKDAQGVACQFPPASLLERLPEKVRAVMSRKAIAHSDEYYQVRPLSKAWGRRQVGSHLLDAVPPVGGASYQLTIGDC